MVEHPAFVSLYQQELEQEGLFIETMDLEHVPKTTVTIFADKEHKDLVNLNVVIPAITAGHSRTTSLEGLTLAQETRADAKLAHVGRLVRKLARTLELADDDIPELTMMLVAGAAMVKERRQSG